MTRVEHWHRFKRQHCMVHFRRTCVWCGCEVISFPWMYTEEDTGKARMFIVDYEMCNECVYWMHKEERQHDEEMCPF